MADIEVAQLGRIKPKSELGKTLSYFVHLAGDSVRYTEQETEQNTRFIKGCMDGNWNGAERFAGTSELITQLADDLQLVFEATLRSSSNPALAERINHEMKVLQEAKMFALSQLAICQMFTDPTRKEES